MALLRRSLFLVLANLLTPTLMATVWGSFLLKAVNMFEALVALQKQRDTRKQAEAHLRANSFRHHMGLKQFAEPYQRAKGRTWADPTGNKAAAHADKTRK